jgi:glycine dehydrogenase subunit 1
VTQYPFLPQTPEQVAEMLSAIGVDSVDALFCDVPSHLLLREAPKLPPALSEIDLRSELDTLLTVHRAAPATRFPYGGGWEPHAVSSLVHRLATLPPFLTAYTPYQAEASQGVLQAFHEFQTMVARLLGCEIANASLYDGATALAEAAFMASEVTGKGRRRRTRVVVSETVPPHARAVLKTYLEAAEFTLVSVPHRAGAMDLDALTAALDDSTCAVIAAHPNFFGTVEDMRPLAAAANAHGALLVAHTEPAVLGVIESPGAMGADVVVADGHSVGLTPTAGGDAVGLFACREAHTRKTPGRLVGTTRDTQGRLAYTLTLQTREQHIRREKATSNICTNQGLHALRCAIHLACLGPQGLREIGLASIAAANAARRAIADVPGVKIAFDQPTASSFVIQVDGEAPGDVGLPLGKWYPELAGHYLVTASELTTPEQVSEWSRALRAAARAEVAR